MGENDENLMGRSMPELISIIELTRKELEFQKRIAEEFRRMLYYLLDKQGGHRD